MLRLLIIFIVLSVLTTLGINLLGLELGYFNYWREHGVLLLIFLTFFPRLALIFSSIPFGGIFWWLAFFICPRYLVAFLATINYWHQNPFLVSISWFVALGGESSEKYYIQRRMRRNYAGPVIDVEAIEVK
jgi:hypothetical protein